MKAVTIHVDEPIYRHFPEQERQWRRPAPELIQAGMKRGIVRTTGWLAMAGVLCLAGCAGTDGGKKEEPKARAELVGRVASVPTGRGFVLIQSYGTWAVPTGEPVFSCGDCETGEEEGRLANLLASGERMGQFVAADVRSGSVEVGDAVYYRPEKGGENPPENAKMHSEGRNEG